MKMTRAWVEAQIEQELERGNKPEAVRDLASLVIVQDYLCNGQNTVKQQETRGMMHPFVMGQGMRDHNEIAIGEYKDQRTSAAEKPVHHHAEEHNHHDHAMPLDKETVMAWVDDMVDSEGVKGGKYTWHQAQQYALNKGITGHQRQLEFYWAMNVMYADYHEAGKKFGVDKPDFYACLAKLFIEDPDAVENKVEEYHRHIAKHHHQ